VARCQRRIQNPQNPQSPSKINNGLSGGDFTRNADTGTDSSKFDPNLDWFPRNRKQICKRPLSVLFELERDLGFWSLHLIPHFTRPVRPKADKY